jgi:hypothetical protein
MNAACTAIPISRSASARLLAATVAFVRVAQLLVAGELKPERRVEADPAPAPQQPGERSTVVARVQAKCLHPHLEASARA